MKLYELANASVDNELQKTAKGIPNKNAGPPGMNPTTGEPGTDPTAPGDGAAPGSAGGDPTAGGQMGAGAGGMGPSGGMDGDPAGGEMGGPGGGDMGGGDMGAPPMGGGGGGPSNSPDAPMQEPEDTDAEEKETKKVDSALMAQVQNMPWVTQYDHNNSKMGPIDVLQKDNADLAQTRTILQNRINQRTMSDQYGVYDDPNVKYYMDMLSYVERVIQIKNQLAKAKRGGMGQQGQQDGQQSGQQQQSDDAHADEPQTALQKQSRQK